METEFHSNDPVPQVNRALINMPLCVAARTPDEIVDHLDGREHRELLSVPELLIEHGVLTSEDLSAVLADKTSNEPICTALKRSGLATDVLVQQMLAMSLGLPFVDPTDFTIEQRAVDGIAAKIARRNILMPLCFADQRLIVAVEDPTDADLNGVLAFSTVHPVELVVATRDDIEVAIGQWYGPQDDRDVLDELDLEYAAVELQRPQRSEIEALGRQKPVVRLVHNMLLDGIRQRASDIHLRPFEERVDLLFRIDGDLIKVRTFDKSLLGAVVSRIKVLGNMDIAEHRLPQDGRFRMKGDAHVVDLRLSVIPTVQGESVVIRILDTRAGLKSLDDIGFSASDADHFTELMARNNGLVLVTGPTGCGKSTTLYAALSEVRKRNINIVTVEDPVEYRLSAINQIEVNAGTGLSFARALRHILRHDPDVIMIGEIRDIETAKIAVESALTGHLVLSTLHTNSAASTITRLLEIGIDPYLVNTSLAAVLAQRLVRRNCQTCLERADVDEHMYRLLGVSEDDTFLRGRGCRHCHGTGYRGRRAVYELLVVTPDLRALIANAASSADIECCAIEGGMQVLTENALTLARTGETSLSEVYRVRLN